MAKLKKLIIVDPQTWDYLDTINLPSSDPDSPKSSMYKMYRYSILQDIFGRGSLTMEEAKSLYGTSGVKIIDNLVQSGLLKLTEAD